MGISGSCNENASDLEEDTQETWQYNTPVEIHYTTGVYVLQLVLICLPSEVLYCFFRGSFKSTERSAARECFYILGCLMLSSNICLGCYFNLHVSGMMTFSTFV